MGDDRIPTGLPQGGLGFCVADEIQNQKCCSLFTPKSLGSLSGVAEKNEISSDYKDHLRKFCPILESYNLHQTAAFFTDWTNEELLLAPLLDVSALLVQRVKYHMLWLKFL